MKKQLKRQKAMQRLVFSTVVALTMLAIGWLGETLFPPTLPTSDNPLLFYSNEINKDIKEAILHSIEEAKESILVIVYTLTDDDVISALKRKSDEGLEVKVITDRGGYKKSKNRLGVNTRLIKRKPQGIMHQKVIVIDKALVWLGSSNLTYDSLVRHNNLMNAVWHPDLAQKFWDRASLMGPKGVLPYFEPYRCQAKENLIELWITPNPQGIKKIGSLIDQAERTLKIGLFTWTHNELRKYVQDAKKRGVKVEVILDAMQSKGTHIETVKKLLAKKIKVGINKHKGLFHHKMLWIDDKILVHGSLNWTVSAFTKNDDLFIIVENLNDDQTALVNSMWETLKKQTKWITNEDWIDWSRKNGEISGRFGDDTGYEDLDAA
jgi:phosphatidylserine/phosphatidylglycerophosphate/cardiolipin synthase-like enzyme